MALEIRYNQNTAYVNTSREDIKVYKSLVPMKVNPGCRAGGKRIGTIFTDEYYIFIGNRLKSQESWAEIAFNDGSGRVKKGYINTTPHEPDGGDHGPYNEYSWVDKQEPYHYLGSRERCNGEKLYVFELSYDSSYRNKKGKYRGKLKAGTLVGLDNSSTGDKYTDYIAVSQIKRKGQDWDQIDNEEFGWVQMQLDEGSEPSDRNLV